MTVGQLYMSWRKQMNAPQNDTIKTDTEMSMQAALEAQRSSYLSEGEVSASTRIDRIDRAFDVYRIIGARK